MTTTIEATYEGGILKPAEALNLPEHQRVRVTIEPIPARPRTDRAEAMRRLRHGIDQMNFRLTGPLPSRDELHDRS